MVDERNQASMATWIIVGVVVVIIILLGWWYFAQQGAAPTNNTANNQANTQLTTLSDQKTVTAFSIDQLNPKVVATVDNTNHTITLTVPKGTDVKKLSPTIQVSDYATVSPASGSEQDFTKPVTYVVTAEDGTKQTYVVTVKVAT
ncbi:DUF5018 domain-containing protein [Candidatus Parcubacteria bacterium]|nr:DUF5018 domain-containing protein [Candidatus Parcubacteria bacterium]